MHVMIKRAIDLKQPDFSDVSNCTCAALRKASRAITHSFDDALRPFDLRATQFTLLATMVKCGDVPLTQLAKALGMDRTTLTRNLKPLMRRQMVVIESDKDQRVRKVSLTDVGRQAFEHALPHWQAVQETISRKLGTERWAGLLDDLNTVVSLVED